MVHIKNNININMVRVAALQCTLADDWQTNLHRLEQLIAQAATVQTQVLCLPELLEGPYFCQQQQDTAFALARPFAAHPVLQHMQELAKRYAMAMAVPFFEQAGPHYYNSVAVVDADGTLLTNCRGAQVYRKSHLPQGPGYQEKFYFRPGNTGFVTWQTRYARLGVGICWDQWYPEAARIMMLRGAELLLYPTAIGSEPAAPQVDTQAEWQLVMRGHAVSNRVPVVAANRIGQEGEQLFYGSSFITNQHGQIIRELSRDAAGIIWADLDLSALAIDRAAWGFFRDRRPDLYADLLEL